MPAQAMIVLGIGHASTAIVATVAQLIKTLRFVATKAMVMLGVGHTAAPIVAAMPQFVKSFQLVTSQAMIVLRISHASALTPEVLFILVPIPPRRIP